MSKKKKKAVLQAMDSVTCLNTRRGAGKKKEGENLGAGERKMVKKWSTPSEKGTPIKRPS